MFGLFDYAITRDQTLRVNFNRNYSKTRNAGVGGYDAVERGYTTQDEGDYFRIQEAGPLGRRFFINTRANIGWADTSNHSVFEGQTIRILDECTTGGAAAEGGHAPEIDQPAVRSRLRARHPLGADGSSGRGRDLPFR